ncbi:MAG: efflux RND transporter periplasmic adaptor subunit [Lentisphaeria bacterium]|nr:efflux RND transporter periplasmic adaptor subunit [Lentisphaeria bacterium]
MKITSQILLGVLLGAILCGCSKQSNGTAMTYRVQQGDLDITVLESGTIQSELYNNIKQHISKMVKIQYIIDEGTMLTEKDVEEGTVIVQMESRDFEDAVYERQTSFENSEAAVIKAEEDLAIQISTNESSIRTAELNVIYAINDLKKLVGEELAELYSDKEPEDIGALLSDKRLGGQALLDMVTFKSDIELAQIKLNRAEQTLEFTQKLYEKQFVSKNELDTDALDVESQKKSLQTTQGKYDIFVTYDFIKDFYKARATLREARDNLERTRAQARSKQVSAESTLRTARQSLVRDTSRLNEAKQDLENCTIRATATGLVVYEPQNQWSNEGPLKAGSEIRPGQNIIQLPDLSRMSVNVKVHESQVDIVEVGQKATITIDALPGQVFTGEVIRKSILPDAQRRWMSEDVKVYTTEIAIRNPGEKVSLRPGMNATAEISIEKLENVVYVPTQSIYTDDKEQHFCYDAATSRAIPVTIGKRNRVFVEITSGLKAGQLILMTPPVTSRNSSEGEGEEESQES